MRISDWSSDVCSSDLLVVVAHDAVEEIVEADDRTVRLGLGAEVVLVEACRQVELVVDLVERVAGLAAQRAEGVGIGAAFRSEEHTSELQSLMRISYAVFCLKKKTI